MTQVKNLLSGIGNADYLKSVGIEPVLNLPGVGENLQDHLEVYVQQEATKPVTLYSCQQYHKMPMLILISLSQSLTLIRDHT